MKQKDPRCCSCGNTLPYSQAEKLEPGPVCDYLLSRGWTEHPSKRAEVRIFQLRVGPVIRGIQVPTNRDLADYAEAMYMVASRVGDIEDRDPNHVLEELLSLRVPRCQRFHVGGGNNPGHRTQCGLPRDHVGWHVENDCAQPQPWCDPEMVTYYNEVLT